MNTAIFFADGFEEIEGLTVVDMFRRAGIDSDSLHFRLSDRYRLPRYQSSGRLPAC